MRQERPRSDPEPQKLFAFSTPRILEGDPHLPILSLNGIEALLGVEQRGTSGSYPDHIEVRRRSGGIAG